MLSVQNRMAIERPGPSARKLTRGAALLVLAGSLAACDLVPQGGYAKVIYRVRTDGIAMSNPPPPPVVPGIGAGGGSEVPTLPASAPAGVTQAMVDEGAKLFGNPCSACHGPGGAGTPAAPGFVNHKWINISGSYDEIVQIIHTGVPKPKEHAGSMPPLGGGTFTDDQVRELAAYVFALSHQGS